MALIEAGGVVGLIAVVVLIPEGYGLAVSAQRAEDFAGAVEVGSGGDIDGGLCAPEGVMKGGCEAFPTFWRALSGGFWPCAVGPDGRVLPSAEGDLRGHEEHLGWGNGEDGSGFICPQLGFKGGFGGLSACAKAKKCAKKEGYESFHCVGSFHRCFRWVRRVYHVLSCGGVGWGLWDGRGVFLRVHGCKKRAQG